MKKILGELELIEQIRSRWVPRRHARGLILGIGDDCAVLRPPPGHELLVTTDLSLEGRHFRRDWHTPESAGHRTLARGLSDLAAMGATPMASFLSLALPPTMLATRSGRLWVERFFAGLRALAEPFHLPLAGGDTSDSPADFILADILLLGNAPAGGALRRSGGRPGDALYVTGQLGGSAAQLATLAAQTSRRNLDRRKNHSHQQSNPQTFPQPRIAVGLALLRRGLASAAIDLSDGLSTDLAHLCRESSAGAGNKIGAIIEAAALPIHPLALAGRAQALDLALNGGEDYELLFAAPAALRMPSSLAGVPITRIGFLVSGAGVSLIDYNGCSRPLKPAGWEHLSARR